MQVQDLSSALGQSPRESSKIVDQFVKSWSDKSKENLKNSNEQLNQIIADLRKNADNIPQVSKLLILQSEVYLAANQQFLAAKSLLGIDFINSNHQLPLDQVLDLQLNICEYLIKMDDTHSAEQTYIRLKALKWEDLKKKIDPELVDFYHLRFRLINAVYIKENGKCLEAATIYENALKNPSLKDYPDQQLQIFDKAVLAALFAENNERRTTLMMALAESPCLSTSTCRNLLQKLISGRLIFPQDIAQISGKLRQSEKREDFNSYVSPLQQSVFNHNLSCLTNIYDVVSTNTLLNLLRMDKLKVYTLLQKMIKSGRVQADIDQVDGYVTFTQNRSSDNEYNQRIREFCSRLQTFIDKSK